MPKTTFSKLSYSVYKIGKRAKEYILSESNHPLILLLLLTLSLLISVAIPFTRYNNLQSWDMAGHYFAAWYTKEYLFPLPIGWNPFFYGGFPQNQFYHPLFHYLVAMGGFIFGLELAFKICLICSILLIPISAFFLGKRLRLKSSEQVMFLSWTWIILWHSPEIWGGNLRAAFNTGEVTNLFAIPFFLFYLAFAIQIFERKRYLLASFILACTLLAHAYAGIAAFLCFWGIAFSQRRGGKDWLIALKHLLLAAFIASFWAAPFLVNRDHVEGLIASSLFYTAPFLILSGFMVYLLFILDWKEGQGNSYDRLSVMMVLFLLVAIHFRFVPKLPIHFVRFRIYVGYIILLPCLYFLRKKHFELTRVDSMALIMLVMLIPWFNTTKKATDIQGYPNNMTLLVHGVPDVDIHIPKVDGRVLCVSTTVGNLQFQARTLSHLIPMKTGNIECVGLFVESAANGPYIQGIQRLIDPESFNWAVHPIGEGLNLGYYLKLFNINYVLSLKDLRKHGFQLADMKVNQSNIVPGMFQISLKIT